MGILDNIKNMLFNREPKDNGFMTDDEKEKIFCKNALHFLGDT